MTEAAPPQLEKPNDLSPEDKGFKKVTGKMKELLSQAPPGVDKRDYLIQHINQKAQPLLANNPEAQAQLNDALAPDQYLSDEDFITAAALSLETTLRGHLTKDELERRLHSANAAEQAAREQQEDDPEFRHFINNFYGFITSDGSDNEEYERHQASFDSYRAAIKNIADGGTQPQYDETLYLLAGLTAKRFESVEQDAALKDVRNEETSQLAKQIILENLPGITREIQEAHIGDKAAAYRQAMSLQLLRHVLVNSANATEHKTALDAWGQSKESVWQQVNATDSELDQELPQFFYSALLTTSDKRQRSGLLRDVRLGLSRPNERAGEVAGETLRKMLAGALESEGKDLVRARLEHLKLEPEEMLRSWENSWSDDKDSQAWAVANNLGAAGLLESKKPGSAKLLAERFGIHDFFRYPPEILERQAETADDADASYGLAVFPRADHNGAFYYARDALIQIQEQLGRQYVLRVAECGSKNDLARQLIRMDRSYGDKQKISFAVLAGHGEKDSIAFGPGQAERAFLRQKDLEGKGVQKAGHFFKPEAPAILLSCSTGSESGIAEKMSSVYGREFTAPREPVIASPHIEALQNNGRITFRVTYQDIEQQPSPGQQLINGKPVNN